MMKKSIIILILLTGFIISANAQFNFFAEAGGNYNLIPTLKITNDYPTHPEGSGYATTNVPPKSITETFESKPGFQFMAGNLTFSTGYLINSG